MWKWNVKKYLKNDIEEKIFPTGMNFDRLKQIWKLLVKKYFKNDFEEKIFPFKSILKE